MKVKPDDIISCASIAWNTPDDWMQINYCQAWYKQLSVPNYNVVVLRSYGTLVACIIDNKMFVFNYYSATTSQHVAKFERLFKPAEVNYMYRRSDRVVYKNAKTVVKGEPKLWYEI